MAVIQNADGSVDIVDDVSGKRLRNLPATYAPRGAPITPYVDPAMAEPPRASPQLAQGQSFQPSLTSHPMSVAGTPAVATPVPPQPVPTPVAAAPVPPIPAGTMGPAGPAGLPGTIPLSGGASAAPPASAYVSDPGPGDSGAAAPAEAESTTTQIMDPEAYSRGTPGYVVPEHVSGREQKTSYSVALPMTPEERAEYEEAQSNRRIALLQEEQARFDALTGESQRLAELAQTHTQVEKEAREQLKDMRERDAEIEKGLERQQAIIDEKIQSVTQIATESPEERLWKRKGSVARVMSVIGLALSEWGRTLAGASGPNPVMQMMIEAVDQEANFQRLQVEEGGRDVAQAQSVYNDMRKTMLSPEAAFDATKAVLTRALEAKLLAAAAASGSDKAKENIDLMLAELARQRAEETMRARQSERVAIEETTKIAGRKVVGGTRGKSMLDLGKELKAAGQDVSLEQLAELYNQGTITQKPAGDVSTDFSKSPVAQQRYVESIKEQAVRLPPDLKRALGLERLPSNLYTLSKAQGGGAEKRVMLDAYSQSMQIVDQMKALVVKHPAAVKTPGTKERQQMRSLGSRLVELRNKIGGRGTTAAAKFEMQTQGMKYLTGAITTEFFTLPQNAEQTLDTTRSLLVMGARDEIDELMDHPDGGIRGDPPALHKYGYEKSREDVGFEPTPPGGTGDAPTPIPRSSLIPSEVPETGAY